MVKKRSKKFKIILSVLALIEVAAIATGITFSWMEGGKRGKIESESITISSSSNLTMYYDDTPVNDINLPICKLEEVSSKDGRNYFFPMPDNTSSQTTSMTFREGTQTDINKRYLSVDLDFEAGDSATKVYLGSGTMISCSDSSVSQNLLNAVKMSISFNDGTDPIVFKPNQMPGIVTVGSENSFNAITAIDRTGAVTTTEQQVTKSYSDYTYKGESEDPLFELSAKERKHFTLSIWLEGTEFTSDTIANKNLDIYVEFTTSADDLVEYRFEDNTRGYTTASAEYWTTNKEEGGLYNTLVYLYDIDNDHYYAMNKSKSYSTNHTWIVYVPDTITNFSFRRYCVDIGAWWNEWTPSMTSIPTDYNGKKTYVAICGTQDGSTGRNKTPCGGYWKDSNGTFRVFFEYGYTDWNANQISCYAWKSSGTAATSTGAWPGTAMKFSHVSNNHNVYYIDLYETDNITGIQFNDRTDGHKRQFDNSQLCNSAAYVVYIENSQSKDSHFLYTNSLNSTIFASNTISIYTNGYSSWTNLYVYGAASTGEPFGAWPGSAMVWDPYTGYYKLCYESTNNTSSAILTNSDGKGGQSATKSNCLKGQSYRYYNDTWYTGAPSQKTY